jgi:hypothetical protein
MTLLFWRDDHGTKLGERTVDAQKPKAAVRSLGVKNRIEGVTVLLTQFA